MRAPRLRTGRFTLITLIALAVAGVGSIAPAAAEVSPDGRVFRPITFPVQGKVTYYDDFGVCRDGCRRSHEGQDLMGSKMMPLLAAASGKVSFLRDDSSGSSGNMLTINDDDGWSYHYMHVNNDTPGTDDNTNPPQYAFAAEVVKGARVTAGQVIGWMGDSGNAESTQAHLHFEMHAPDDVPFSPYVSLRVAQGIGTGGQCRWPTNPKAGPDAAANPGYWAVDSSGAVFSFGRATYYGGLALAPGAARVVDMAATPTGLGYWLIDAAGGVHPFGDAVQYGSTAGMPLNAPIIAMTPTGTGLGYWLLGRDGGIFSFGDAQFDGSMGGTRLNAPVISMSSTPSGRGYWLLASDGGIFSYGEAVFQGSTGAMTLAAPVVGMATTENGGGYYLLGRDGGVFAFGDAGFRGSVPGTGWCALPTSISMTTSATGRGYWVLTTDGKVMAYGDAALHGEPATFGGRPIVLTAIPS
ncbi:MAG: M23 family metallopeptidase [Actinomycetota bacterium]